MPRLTNCPNCDADLEPGAVLCIDCGYHVKTGRQLKTRSKPLVRKVGRTPVTRWRIFNAVGIAAIGLLAIGVMFGGVTIGGERLGGNGLLLGVFLLFAGAAWGCDRSFMLSRDKKGRAALVRKVWIVFVPFEFATIYLADWDALYFDFWLDLHDRATFSLKLGRQRPKKFLTIYKGRNEERMKDLADAIKEMTGMPFERL